VQRWLVEIEKTTTWMQQFKGRCSRDAALTVAVSKAAVQLQQQHSSWWTVCQTSAA